MDTWDVLLSIGLRRDDTLEMPGYVLDFGNFKLQAIRAPNRWFVDVVHLVGTMPQRGGITIMDEQLPAIVSSREEALAFLASMLDRSSRGRRFVPAEPLAWLEEGRAHFHLVPWERQLMEARERQQRYRAAPKCWVERDWMRLALRSLKRTAENEAASSIRVSFDGSSLRFEHSGEPCVMAGRGESWPSSVSVSARHFLQSVRLSPLVEVCVLDRTLRIAQCVYPMEPDRHVQISASPR